MTLEVDVLTLFPAMVEGPLGESIPARILDKGLATVRVHDLRRWGLGKHRSVDDYTYGGGAGMVLRPEPVAAALAELRRPASEVILLDPAGEVFRQATAQSLAAAEHLVLLCPRYEGVDERIRSMVDRELSIGDYVLTGGELAALVVVDAVLRLLPGAIDDASTAEESFAAGLLEYPQYTRPATFEGVSVPPGARVRPPRGGPTLAAPGVAAPHARAATRPARRPGPLARGAPAAGRGARRARRGPAGAGRRAAGRRGRRRLTRATRRAILRRRPAAFGMPPKHQRAPCAAAAASLNEQGPVPVNVLNEIVQDQLRTDLPVITPGDTVKVAAKVVEGNRERIQVFEGLVMRVRNSGIASTITVRRIASGVGVERTFKLHSPRIDRIEVVRHGQVRRAKLYFLRNRVGKAATTLRERR